MERKKVGIEASVTPDTAYEVMRAIKKAGDCDRKIYDLVVLYRQQHPTYSIVGVVKEVANGIGRPWATVRDIYYTERRRKNGVQ